MPANPPHYPFQDDPFEWHPYAQLFPMMDEDEIESLAQDIEQNGQLAPVQIYDGMILDGRNRYQAIDSINHRRLVEGKEPLSLTYGTFANEVNPVNDARALAFVKSHNLTRRNLTTSQRAAIATELEEHYADIAKREEAWRKSKAAKEEMTSVNSHESPFDRRSDTKAAKALGVGQQSVARAKAIKQADPELFNSVRDGKTSVNAAYNQIKPKPKKESEPEIEPELTPQNIEVSNDEVLVAFSSNLGFFSPDQVQFCLNEIYNTRKSDLIDFLAKLKITDPLLFN